MDLLVSELGIPERTNHSMFLVLPSTKKIIPWKSKMINKKNQAFSSKRDVIYPVLSQSLSINLILFHFLYNMIRIPLEIIVFWLFIIWILEKSKKKNSNKKSELNLELTVLLKWLNILWKKLTMRKLSLKKKKKRKKKKKKK